MKVVHCKKEKFDVYIGRPSVWGNPYPMFSEDDRSEVISKYREWILAQPQLIERAKKELRGKVLACWCAPRPCHGDVLMEIANS